MLRERRGYPFPPMRLFFPCFLLELLDIRMLPVNLSLRGQTSARTKEAFSAATSGQGKDANLGRGMSPHEVFGVTIRRGLLSRKTSCAGFVDVPSLQLPRESEAICSGWRSKSFTLPPFQTRLQRSSFVTSQPREGTANSLFFKCAQCI